MGGGGIRNALVSIHVGEKECDPVTSEMLVIVGHLKIRVDLCWPAS